MKCYCYETDANFIYCVEDVESPQLETVIQHMGWEKTEDKFLMSHYPGYAISNPNEKELISGNYARLGQAFFESFLSSFDWKKPLDLLAQKFNESGIEWYIVGSVSDAVRGVNVKPHDMDIVIHTRDYCKAKDICYFNFSDSVIAPFTDIQGLFAMRYFGRMFLAGALVEIAADEQWNLENRQPKYEKISWNNHDLYVDSLQLRYQTEIARNREDRIKAIEAYMNQ